MKKYKVSHLAQEMGVSPDLLKLYEEFGLINPQRDPDSQYRYYDIYHGGKLVSCLTLRNMGFTIRQTAEALESLNLEALDHALAERRATLEAERARLDWLIPAATEFADLMRKFQAENVQGTLCSRSGYYFLAQSASEEFQQNAGQKRLARRLMDALPRSERLLLLDGNTMRPDDVLRFQWGLALREDLAGDWPTKEMLHLPPCRCLRFYQNIPAGRVCIESFQKELAWMETAGYTLAGDPVCQLPLTTVEAGEKISHYVLYLPVAPDGKK